MVDGDEAEPGRVRRHQSPSRVFDGDGSRRLHRVAGRDEAMKRFEIGIWRRLGSLRLIGADNGGEAGAQRGLVEDLFDLVRHRA